VVFDAIKLLLEAEEKPKPKIGFTVKERVKAYGRKMGIAVFFRLSGCFRVRIKWRNCSAGSVRLSQSVCAMPLRRANSRKRQFVQNLHILHPIPDPLRGG
jgi:hypothetical protein